MKMTLWILYCCVAVLSASGPAVAQRAASGADKKDQPKDAWIKILNVCDTAQPERWRTGLDLRFQDQTIGGDIRIGETGPVGKIAFTGKDFIEVFRHGTDAEPLVRVPANLKAGGHYSLVIMGELNAGSANLDVRVIEEYPIPQESLRPGHCRVQLLNAVQKFPVAVEINRQKLAPIAFGEIREVFLLPGEMDIGLVFTDARGETRRLQSGLVARPGDHYTAVIHPSAERSDRPDLFRAKASGEPAVAMDPDEAPPPR
jgi:hypothetical protein